MPHFHIQLAPNTPLHSHPHSPMKRPHQQLELLSRCTNYLPFGKRWSSTYFQPHTFSPFFNHNPVHQQYSPLVLSLDSTDPKKVADAVQGILQMLASPQGSIICQLHLIMAKLFGILRKIEDKDVFRIVVECITNLTVPDMSEQTVEFMKKKGIMLMVHLMRKRCDESVTKLMLMAVTNIIIDSEQLRDALVKADIFETIFGIFQEHRMVHGADCEQCREGSLALAALCLQKGSDRGKTCKAANMLVGRLNAVFEGDYSSQNCKCLNDNSIEVCLWVVLEYDLPFRTEWITRNVSTFIIQNQSIEIFDYLISQAQSRFESTFMKEEQPSNKDTLTYNLMAEVFSNYELRIDIDQDEIIQPSNHRFHLKSFKKIQKYFHKQRPQLKTQAVFKHGSHSWKRVKELSQNLAEYCSKALKIVGDSERQDEGGYRLELALQFLCWIFNHYRSKWIKYSFGNSCHHEMAKRMYLELQKSIVMLIKLSHSSNRRVSLWAQKLIEVGRSETIQVWLKMRKLRDD